MRHNPYLKNRSIFLPLLMRGSQQNSVTARENAIFKELLELSESTYSIEGISFKMVKSSRMNDKLQPLPNIEMCGTECTQELFEKIMGFNPSYFQGNADSSKRPVEEVSWFDCLAFCNGLSTKLGLPEYYELAYIKYQGKSIEEANVSILGGNGFRLPTEAEWKLFAKANTSNRWSGTSNRWVLGDYAWYIENANRETHPVAQKKPNEWGMYDMSGNVWEWCWDKYDPKNTNASAHRVFRGGCYGNEASFLHLTSRLTYPPDFHSDGLGFRFCRSLD